MGGDITLVLRGVQRLLTLDGNEEALGAHADAAIAIAGDRVAWIGPDAQAPDAPDVRDLRGAVVLPGLVDCHTHAVWAGSRSDEFLLRLAGRDYSSILEGGGGILSTVRATRACPEAELVQLCAARLLRLRARGVTTVEVKSGYGLTPSAELKLLRAARQAGQMAGIRVLTTFLGAHTVPEEHRGDREGYVEQIVVEQLPLVAEHADFIDVYVDRGAFTVEEGERILRAGMEVGLKPRIHAEQVTFTGAARMAASLGAFSADHLERIDDEGVAAMAAAGTVGVMLPGAMITLGDDPPPVVSLREAGVPLAVATDLNPGTSPVYDPWLCASLACVSMKLTVPEAIAGLTLNGARALGRPDLGRLYVGGPADVVAVRPPPGEPITEAALVQGLAGVAPALVIAAGEIVGGAAP